MPQGSLLGSLMLLMYVIDRASGLENPCTMFADEIDLLVRASSGAIKRDQDIVYQWSVTWDLPLNFCECQRLVEGEANLSLYMGPRGHQVALEKNAASKRP